MRRAPDWRAIQGASVCVQSASSPSSAAVIGPDVMSGAKYELAGAGAGGIAGEVGLQQVPAGRQVVRRVRQVPDGWMGARGCGAYAGR